jgi:sugar O-acyltransferase (sialic acid O-acetyltransferase NeuD family)
MKKTEKIVLFGNTNYAQLLSYCFTHDSPYEVVAFTVDRKYMNQNECYGLPNVPFEDIEDIYPPDKFKMFIALGYSSINKLRTQKYIEAKQKGYSLVSYINSSASIWENLKIGDNCAIFESEIIHPFVTIGNNVTLHSGGLVAHHSKIGDHCFISAKVVICGNVTVEPYCYLGANSSIRDGITIAREGIIGMSAVVVKNTSERGVYIGIPAHLISNDSSATKI